METTHPQPQSKVPFTSPGYSGEKTLFLYQYFLQASSHVEWDPELQEWLMTEEGSQLILKMKDSLNSLRLKGHTNFPEEPPLLPIPTDTLSAAKIALRIRIQSLWQRRNAQPNFKRTMATEIRENVRALRNLRQTFLAYAVPHFQETLRHWPLELPSDNYSGNF